MGLGWEGGRREGGGCWKRGMPWAKKLSFWVMLADEGVLEIGEEDGRGGEGALV